jgi:hypothetical protein
MCSIKIVLPFTSGLKSSFGIGMDDVKDDVDEKDGLPKRHPLNTRIDSVNKLIFFMSFV